MPRTYELLTEGRCGHGPDAYRRRPSGTPYCTVCTASGRRARYVPRSVIAPNAADLTAYFWRRVDKTDDAGCWPWRGSLASGGYPVMHFRSQSYRAHRFALEQRLGRPLESTEYACHTCDNPPCVRPDHLFEGSALDNMRDASAKGRMAEGARNARSLHPFRGLPAGRLTPARVEIIRLSLAEGITGAHVARFLGVSQATVSRIANGTRHVRAAA